MHGKHGVPRSAGWSDIIDIVNTNLLVALGGFWLLALIVWLS